MPTLCGWQEGCGEQWVIGPQTTQSLVGVEIRGMPYVCSLRVKHGLDVLSNPRVVSPVRAPVPSGVSSVVRIIQHVCPNPLPAARVGRWYPREFSVWGVQPAWWLHHPKSRSDVADSSSPSCLYHVLRPDIGPQLKQVGCHA